MEKICFLMATPFTKGGEQRVVSVLSNLLYEKGFDVTILCTDFTPINYDLYNLNPRVNIIFLDGYQNPVLGEKRVRRDKLYKYNLETGRYKHFLSIQKYINCDNDTRELVANCINKEGFDYVISLSTIYNTMLAVISNRIKAKTIGWQHSCFERYFRTPGERHYNQDKFSKYMFKQLDEYVVLTTHDQQRLKEEFNINSIVINNPKSINSNIVSTLENKKFVALGRFVEVKNYEMLIDMFYEFNKKNKEWTLDIYGEGPLKDKLIEKVKTYNLEDYITIHPYEQNVENCYLNGSVYLMSSLMEGWGMVIGEAMEFGLPVISFNISSAPEMITDNKNGFIVENYNKEMYVNKMLQLAENPDLLHKMGKEARNASLSRTNISIANQWINLFTYMREKDKKYKLFELYDTIRVGRVRQDKL